MIKFEDIKIPRAGLRYDSFEYLEPFFKEEPGEFPVLPHWKNKILLGDYPAIGLTVIDGRHRLLLSKKWGVKHIPVKYIKYDQDLYPIEERDEVVEV